MGGVIAQKLSNHQVRRGSVNECPWSGSVFWVFFSALTLMFGWQERHPACTNLFVNRTAALVTFFASNMWHKGCACGSIKKRVYTDCPFTDWRESFKSSSSSVDIICSAVHRISFCGVTNFGRPFMKLFALCYQTVVSPVCQWRWCIVAKRLDGSRCHLVWR